MPLEKAKNVELTSARTTISANVHALTVPTATSAFTASPQIILDQSAPSAPVIQPELAARPNLQRVTKGSKVPADSVLSDFGAAAYSRSVLIGADGEEVVGSYAAEDGFLPRFMRGIGWSKNLPVSESRTVTFTEFDDPLPRPPL